MPTLVIDGSAARTGGGPSRLRELAAAASVLSPQHRYVFALNPALVGAVPRFPPRTDVIQVPRTMSSPPLRLIWQNAGLPRVLTRVGTDAVLGPFNLLPLRGLPSKIRRALIVSNIGPFVPEVSAAARGYQAARNRLLRSLTLRSIAAADCVFLLSLEASELLGPALRGKSVEMLPMSPPPPDVIVRAKDTDLPFEVSSRSFAVIGDLMPNKGIEDAVRAVAALDRNGERPTLLVVGNPVQPKYARALRALAATEAPGAVRFVKGLSQEQALAGLMIRLLDDDGLADGLKQRGEERLAGRDWLTATRTILKTLQLL